MGRLWWLPALLERLRFLVRSMGRGRLRFLLLGRKLRRLLSAAPPLRLLDGFFLLTADSGGGPLGAAAFLHRRSPSRQIGRRRVDFAGIWGYAY